MLQRECMKARGDGSLALQDFGTVTHTDFEDDVEQYSDLCFEELPTLLLHAVKVQRTGEWTEDNEWFLHMNDGRVEALYVYSWGEKMHWLRREGGPWVSTIDFATIKSYDEHSRGGVMEWKDLGPDCYEIEFDNMQSTDADTYLCDFDKVGIMEVNQARNDADTAREEEKARLRRALVVTMSKEERAKRTAREGRFWCLA
jgi:hypothetical protein